MNIPRSVNLAHEMEFTVRVGRILRILLYFERILFGLVQESIDLQQVLKTYCSSSVIMLRAPHFVSLLVYMAYSGSLAT